MAKVDLVPPGRFVHRILFWPKPMRKIEVVFSSLKSRPNRDLIASEESQRDCSV